MSPVWIQPSASRVFFVAASSRRLPAVLAGNAPADDPHAAPFTFPGFAEQPQPFAVAARATKLPRAGTWGLLFDLDSGRVPGGGTTELDFELR